MGMARMSCSPRGGWWESRGPCVCGSWVVGGGWAAIGVRGTGVEWGWAAREEEGGNVRHIHTHKRARAPAHLLQQWLSAHRYQQRGVYACAWALGAAPPRHPHPPRALLPAGARPLHLCVQQGARVVQGRWSGLCEWARL